MLEIQNVTKQFGETPVLRGVSASIAKGEIFAVIGPSGVGKSTLLRLINLLDTPTGGRILLDGVDIHADRRRTLEFRRRMGMVFQKPAAFNATVYENIALGLRFRGESGRRVREKVADGLDLVGLTGYEQRKARTLSGGEMQRVSLARVMVTDPEILLLDEPTANLDPVSAEVIEDLVLRINREYKTTVVMSTHDRFQGQRLARRIGVMMDGDFVQIGTPREIFTAPNDRKVARFVGIENIVEGVVASAEHGLAVIDAGGVQVQAVTQLPVGTRVCLCLRPEDIGVSCTPAHAASVRNVLPGRVAASVPMGPLNRLVLDCGIRLTSLITWKAAEELGIGEGSEICASFKATAVHVVPDRR